MIVAFQDERVLRYWYPFLAKVFLLDGARTEELSNFIRIQFLFLTGSTIPSPPETHSDVLERTFHGCSTRGRIP